MTSPEFRGDRERPESWLENAGETLRELRGRRVFRTRIGDQPCVVKLYQPRRLRRWVRRYAETEAERALATRIRGVPVVEPLAHAALRDGRQILVLRDEVGARSLQDVILDRERSDSESSDSGEPAAGSFKGGRGRRELARAVGRLIATLLNAGIRWDDAHAGNVLVRPDGSVLIADAWNLRPGDYLSADERARVVAQFAPFFLTHGKLSDLLMFWGEYGRVSSFLPEDLEAHRARVMHFVPAAFRKLAGSRARRARRAGRPIQLGRFTGFATNELGDAALEQIVAMATDLREGPHVLKRSPTAWTLAVNDDWVAKVFLPKKITRPLRDFVKGTRAERAMEAAQALEHRGLKTPEVVAVLRDGILPTRSILVMRRERTAQPFPHVLESLSPSAARTAAARLGRTLRRMHDWGLRHRDLKHDNILADRDGTGFRFLDLDGIRQTRCGHLDWERRARDLGHLSGSLLDRNAVPTGLRLRLLDAYLGTHPPAGWEPGEFARKVNDVARGVESRKRESVTSAQVAPPQVPPPQ